MREEDRDRVLAIEMQAFNAPPGIIERMRAVPPEAMRVAVDRGSVVAALRIHGFGHFFGGRSVPAAGIAAVAVAPEARGRRVAEVLMIETLRELRDEGIALSTLYPATVPLYRRCGYEYGALRTRFRAPLRALPRSAPLACEPWGDEALDEVEACYRSFAASSNGLIDRPREWWPDRLLARHERDVYRFLVREEGRVTGSIVYTQDPAKGSDWGYDLECRDLVWTTPGAAGALLALAGRHRSLGKDLVWVGPPAEPLAALLAEQDLSPDWCFRLMARIVDLPAAFEARGYPESARASVDLRVTDEHLPSNAGAWRLEVADGGATVGSVPDAKTTVDVGTLSALWTGLLSPGDARRIGRLDADDETVRALESMLSGPVPWVVEIF